MVIFLVCKYYAFCQPTRNVKLFKSECWREGECCRVFTYLQQHLKKLRPIDGNYYDLIRIPHGHIPVPNTNLWSRLPLSVKEFRDEHYYRCPTCGAPTFFKIKYMCEICFEDDDIFEQYSDSKHILIERKDYFRNFLKRIEYLFLPILILTGKAYYVLASSRLSMSVKQMKQLQFKRR
jgi:hypothetical protein